MSLKKKLNPYKIGSRKIKVNEDINIRIGVTYKGLHPNEKEKIRNKVGADVSFFDDATLHLEENDEKLFFDNWINSESPQKRIDRIEREIN